MGRTVPSFRMLLEGIITELSDFRRALRGDDRAAFDSLTYCICGFNLERTERPHSLYR